MGKITIQSRDTGLFYAGPNLWVSEVGGAIDFPTARDAIAHVLQNHIEDVQILISTALGTKSVIFPVELPPDIPAQGI